MDRFVVISGCSGGGKSAVLSELKRHGYAVIEEPGRRIIAEELSGSGEALPWVNLAAFAERAMEISLRDRERAKGMRGLVFFDRGLIDAAAAHEHATGQPTLRIYSAERYNPRVFMMPPWPEIYVNDIGRRHGLREAIEEYERLLVAYSTLGYTTEVLPRTGVAQRVDMIIERLRSARFDL
jgi:predicted ATPase